MFESFYEKFGISHVFSTPETSQYNRVVERKKRTLQEIARVILNSKRLICRLWAEVVNIAYYIINRVHIRQCLNKTPYEILKGKNRT